jgi:hypothetical protein
VRIRKCRGITEPNLSLTMPATPLCQTEFHTINALSWVFGIIGRTSLYKLFAAANSLPSKLAAEPTSPQRTSTPISTGSLRPRRLTRDRRAVSDNLLPTFS